MPGLPPSAKDGDPASSQSACPPAQEVGWQADNEGRVTLLERYRCDYKGCGKLFAGRGALHTHQVRALVELERWTWMSGGLRSCAVLTSRRALCTGVAQAEREGRWPGQAARRCGRNELAAQKVEAHPNRRCACATLPRACACHHSELRRQCGSGPHGILRSSGGRHLLPAQPRHISARVIAGAETAPKPPPQNLSSIDLKGSNATKLIEEVADTTKNAAVKDLIALCVLANMFELPKSAEAAAAQQQEGE